MESKNAKSKLLKLSFCKKIFRKLEGLKEEKENINQTINKLEAEIQETQRKEHVLAQQRSQIKVILTGFSLNLQ